MIITFAVGWTTTDLVTGSETAALRIFFRVSGGLTDLRWPLLPPRHTLGFDLAVGLVERRSVAAQFLVFRLSQRNQEILRHYAAKCCVPVCISDIAVCYHTSRTCGQRAGTYNRNGGAPQRASEYPPT